MNADLLQGAVKYYNNELEHRGTKIRCRVVMIDGDYLTIKLFKSVNGMELYLKDMITMNTYTKAYIYVTAQADLLHYMRTVNE